MSTEAEFAHELKKIVGMQKAQIRTGSVLSVNQLKRTCVVSPSDEGADFPAVRLNSISSTGDGLILYPTVGSEVSIALINNDDLQAHICAVSEVDRISYIKGGVEFDIDDAGFRIKKDPEDMLTLISDLIDQIVMLTVTTGIGPSGTPINAIAIAAIKTRFMNLLKA